MTVSGGTWQARSVILGINGGRGSLTFAGGTSHVYSNMILSASYCGAIGVVNLTGGALRVTNNAANAVLDVRGGTFTHSGGTLDVDRLIITNSCGHFMHTGGTLITGLITLSTNFLADADADGIDYKWEQDNGLDPLDPTDATLDNDGDGQS